MGQTKNAGQHSTRETLYLCVILCLLLSLGVISRAGANQNETGFSIFVPDSVQRGLPVAVIIDAAETVHSIRLELATETNLVVSRNQAFPFSGQNQNERSRSWVGLLGVPSTVSPGRYRVVVHTDHTDSIITRIRYVDVRETAYLDSVIALNQTMSALRETTDPERYRQTKELLEVLDVFNPLNRYAPGSHIIPVEQARESALFGDRRIFRYADGSEARSIHNGLDLAAPVGAPIRSSAAGRVVMAQDRIITGYTIVLEHMPGVYGLYYHLDSLEVSEGEFVQQGDRIGTVGATGLVTGPHLHWEIRVGGVPIEPKSLIETPLIDKDLIMSIISIESTERNTHDSVD
jgi:murein DD-endopeptidase MepM/ murein hydrolase activator NlpD